MPEMETEEKLINQFLSGNRWDSLGSGDKSDAPGPILAVVV
jgi:hypothetical protein